MEVRLLLLVLHSLYTIDLFRITHANITHVEAVQKENVHLPCNITTKPGDDAVLILWYKEDQKNTPIYSFDNRPWLGQLPKRWSDPFTFGDRASLAFDKPFKKLLIRNIQKDDSGIYRCRVDFIKSQTRNSRINVSVIVPPKHIAIRDSLGKARSTVVGPYNEGETVTLKCEVNGGYPIPRVEWYYDGVKISSKTFYTEIGSTVKSEVFLGPLTRKDFNSKLVCKALVHSQLPALEATVQIDMNFSPLTINLLGVRHPLSAGRRYDLLCQSAGARPPAVITWWLNGTRLEKTTETTSSDGNQTTSTLSITLSKKETGLYLSCKSYGQAGPAAIIEDGWILNVQYAPEINVTLGPSLKADDIKEGTDVYFNCLVDAHPPVFRIDWLRNENVLPHNISQGVIKSNYSLVLQGIHRSAAGNYTCVGFNVEGEGRSPQFIININYAPKCLENQQTIFSISKHESKNIKCLVDAFPSKLNFSWIFNGSVENTALSPLNIKTFGTSSILTYTPRSDLGYGTLLCTATNQVGKQSSPCAYHIIPSGKPEKIQNCSLINISLTTLTVTCNDGLSVGLPQLFALELKDSYTNETMAFITSSSPRFTVAALSPGNVYTVSIYAFNARGKSDPIILNAALLQMPEKQSTSNEDKPRRNIFFPPTATFTFGVLLAVVIAGLALALALRMPCASSQDDVGSQKIHTFQIKNSYDGKFRIFKDFAELDENPDIVAEILDSEKGALFTIIVDSTHTSITCEQHCSAATIAPLEKYSKWRS